MWHNPCPPLAAVPCTSTLELYLSIAYVIDQLKLKTLRLNQNLVIPLQDYGEVIKKTHFKIIFFLYQVLVTQLNLDITP